MPVYMVEDYVEASIMSVVNQTYNNIELICINDASKDSSYDICVKLSKEYDQIRVLRNVDANGKIASVNLGQEVTRNTGLLNAKGEFFMFLDSDDTLDPQTIEKAVEKASDTNADLVMFTYSEIRKGKTIDVIPLLDSGFYSMEEFSKNLLDIVPWHVISCIGSKLYRTHLRTKFNLLFDKTYKYNEDCAFALKYLTYSKSIFFLNEPYYKYLIRDTNSTMSSYRPNMYYTNSKVVELIKVLFDTHGVFEQKKYDYYLHYFYIYIDSLINEGKFGHDQKIAPLVRDISNSESFPKVYKELKSRFGFTQWQRWMLAFLKDNRAKIITAFIHMKTGKKKDLLSKVIIRLQDTRYRLEYSINNSENCSRIYMFHDFWHERTDEKRFKSNIDSFKEFLNDELRKRTPVNLEEVLKKKNSFALTFDDGYDSIYKMVYPILKEKKIPFTVFIIENCIGNSGYMSQKMIEELRDDDLCTIGSHTLSHTMLRYDDNSKGEIHLSKKRLQERLGVEIEFFAFPYGSTYACSTENIRTVSESGYSLAVSTISGCVNSAAKKNKYFLPRINGDPLVSRYENNSGGAD